MLTIRPSAIYFDDHGSTAKVNLGGDGALVADLGRVPSQEARDGLIGLLADHPDTIVVRYVSRRKLGSWHAGEIRHGHFVPLLEFVSEAAARTFEAILEREAPAAGLETVFARASGGVEAQGGFRPGPNGHTVLDTLDPRHERAAG